MLDERSFSQKVICKDQNAFVREERDGHHLLIPEGFTQDSALDLNKQGFEISELCHKEMTVGEIVAEMQARYPEVDAQRVASDTLCFLSKWLQSDLIDVEGVEDMYSGYFLKEQDGFKYYKCREGDLKTIRDTFESKVEHIDLWDMYKIPGWYEPIYLRAAVFRYAEEFYLLLDRDDEVIAITGLRHGYGSIPEVARVGRIAVLDEVSEARLSDWLADCINDFKNDVIDDSNKIRMSLSSADENTPFAKRLLESAGFSQSAYLANEFGVGKDALMMELSLI